MNYLNIALRYFELMKFNVLPLHGKIPTVKWKVWQDKCQTKEDIEAMEWKNSSGVGVVMGMNDLRCFDIDMVEEPAILNEILSDLNLPGDYSWVVQSGSGEGYHIYFRCSEASLQSFSDKAVYKYRLKKEGICHHIELRVKECQTALPPSRHESGGVYSFVNNEQLELPTVIADDKVIECIRKHCLIGKEYESKQENEKRLYYDKKRLEDAIKYLSIHLPAGSYDDWITIGFGLASLGRAGEEYFLKMSLGNPNYGDTEEEVKAKFATLLSDYDGTAAIHSVYRIAENYGWQKPVIHFWYLDERRQIKISRTRFKRFLEGEGYFKLKKDSSYLFIRITDTVIEEVDTVQIKDFVLEYLYTLPAEEFQDISRSKIIDVLIKGANQYFANQFLEFLITREIDFKRDTAKEGFLFFENGYVTVTADSVTLNEYKIMDGYIWAKQIIRRKYYPTNFKSDFEEFLHNACRQDVQRTMALKSAIGYLLHIYKDPNNAKAIIFIDEKLSEGAYGRSGKGLVIKAISKIRTVVIEDGRNFEVGKNFAFQRVSADSNIIAIEDMREKFPFDKLFSIISEGITIEKKMRDEIFIHFPESPKIVISSNFSIKGVDDSTQDRQFIIEFSDHYNRKTRPVDEFGKLFFEGWSIPEWRTFDCLMIDCLQLHLREGFLEYEHVNLERKQLIDETSEEFAEFTDDLKLNHKYDKKTLFRDFKDTYEGYDKLSPGKLTIWLKIWARIKNYEVLEGKSGANRTIIFSSIKMVA